MARQFKIGKIAVKLHSSQFCVVEGSKNTLSLVVFKPEVALAPNCSIWCIVRERFFSFINTIVLTLFKRAEEMRREHLPSIALNCNS